MHYGLVQAQTPIMLPITYEKTAANVPMRNISSPLLQGLFPVTSVRPAPIMKNEPKLMRTDA